MQFVNASKPQMLFAALMHLQVLSPDNIYGIFNDANKLVHKHSWTAISAFLIGLLVRLLKTEEGAKLFPWISSKYRVMVAIFLGQIAAVLESIVQGSRPHEAVLNGVAATAIAVLGHDLLIEGMRGGKELFDLSGKKRDSRDR